MIAIRKTVNCVVLVSCIVIFFTLFFSLPAGASSLDDLDKLVEGAKKEGRLMLYTSGDAGQSALLLSKFREKYPFIQTEFYRTGKVGLLSKVLMEHRFKRYTADAIVSSLVQTNIMKKSGTLAPSFPPEAKILPAEMRDSAGYWYAVYSSEVVTSYNTRLVAPGEAPKSYEDLTDPRWTGKIAIETNKMEWFATMLKLKGEQFFEKLSRLRPSVRSGETISVQLLAAGEYSMLVDSYLFKMLDSKDMGMHIDWVVLEPVVVYFVAASVAANAPHPNASKLFVNFLLSQRGQQAVVKWGRTPIRSDVESRSKRIIDNYRLAIADVDIGERENEINKMIAKYFR